MSKGNVVAEVTHKALSTMVVVIGAAMMLDAVVASTEPTPSLPPYRKCCFNQYDSWGACHDNPPGHTCTYGAASCRRSNCIGAQRCECWKCPNHDCASCPLSTDMPYAKLNISLPATVVTAANNKTAAVPLQCTVGYEPTTQIMVQCLLTKNGTAEWSFSPPLPQAPCKLSPAANYSCLKSQCVPTQVGVSLPTCKAVCHST